MEKISIIDETKIANEVIKGEYNNFIKQYSNLINFIIKKTLKKIQKYNEENMTIVYGIVLPYILKEGLKKWDPKKGRKLSSWISLITTHKTIDYFKKTDAYEKGEIINLGYEDEYIFESDLYELIDIDYLIDLKNKKLLLLYFINQLPDNKRKVMEYSLDGLENKEISKHLNLSSKKISRIKDHSKKILKNKMLRYFKEKNGQSFEKDTL